MNWRRFTGRLTVAAAFVVMVAGSTLVGGGTTAYAMPAVPISAVSASYGVPKETGKIVLPETSYDGPAFWTQGGPSSPESGLYTRMYIAWTGTDTRLNFMGINDATGISLLPKKTLNETSFVRPAIARADKGAVVIAWTGMDAGHHLNVLYDAGGTTPTKLTLWQDSSFTSPALTVLDDNTIMLAWAGTDAGHSLNVLPLSFTDHGLVPGAKVTLWDFHSLGQPDIVGGPSTGLTSPTAFLLGWADMSSQRIAWATSPDGKTWTQQPAFHETSGFAPSLMVLPEQPEMPLNWLAWTGTDAGHHVNVLYALSLNEFTTNNVKATLAESAVGGTVVRWNYHGIGKQMYIAWTGTDKAHHLNIATIDI